MVLYTSPDNLPYPEDADVPDIPKDVQALADATQAALNDRTAPTSRQLYIGVRQDVDFAMTTQHQWYEVTPQTVETQPSGTEQMPFTPGQHLQAPVTGVYFVDLSCSMNLGSAEVVYGSLRLSQAGLSSAVRYQNFHPVVKGNGFSTTWGFSTMAVYEQGNTFVGAVMIDGGTANFQALALRVFLVRELNSTP